MYLLVVISISLGRIQSTLATDLPFVISPGGQNSFPDSDFCINSSSSLPGKFFFNLLKDFIIALFKFLKFFSYT